MEAAGERDVRANNNETVTSAIFFVLKISKVIFINIKTKRNTSVLTYTGIFAVVFFQKGGSQSQKSRRQNKK
jgi:hypothetical protein